ncbi:MAG: hypothetical protein EU521_00115 [Promethearchaeota archaeon]|nr:MAG: hypothetical protein EU521_00115 [Candidatus Lokiarchaeota archaeon]
MNAKRNESIGFRVTSEEKLMIKQAAEAFQKTVSGFIRDIILGISGDIVKIRTCTTTSINYTPVQKLNPPPSARLTPKKFPKSQHPLNEFNATSRGSVLDFKNCMKELKKVLQEKILIEC